MNVKVWLLVLFGIAFCSTVFSAQPASKEALFKKGLELKEKGKQKEALEQFRSALNLDPSYIEAHRHYMDLLIDQGKRAELQKEYRALLDQHPDSPAYLYLYSRLLEDNNQSFRYYCKARDLDPRFIWSYLGMAYVYRVKGLNSKSVDTLRSGLQIDPHNASLILNLARSFEGLGDTQKAEDSYVLLITDPEYRLSALLALGDLYYEKDQFLKAKEFYEKAAEINDKNASLHFRLGYIYEWEKKFDKAAKEYKTSLELDPKKWLAANNLASYYQNSKKDLKKAELYYKQALEVDPKLLKPRRNLAEVYLEQGRSQEALQHLEELMKLNPLNQDAYLSAGVAMEKQEKYYSAVKYFSTAYELDKKPYPHYWNIGLMYQKSGEFDKAFKLYKMLQQADPKNPQREYINEWIPYMQKILSNARVHIDDIRAEPSTVRKGGVINMVLEYSISGVGDQRLLLTEERGIEYGNQTVGSPVVHFQHLPDGKYKSVIQIAIPASAKPGNYIYNGWLNLCGARAEKMAAFKVL